MSTSSIIPVNNNPLNLVADIGGTNIRLAISDSNNMLIGIETYQCRDFSCLLDVIQCYLTENKITKASICLLYTSDAADE